VRSCQPQLVPPAIPTPNELKLLSHIDDQEALRLQIPAIPIYQKQASMAEKDPVEQKILFVYVHKSFAEKQKTITITWV